MSNPLVAQGTLNRLIGNVAFTTTPQLNVTAPYLGTDGISLSLEGESTTYINTLTGAITSPEPYQRVNISIHLNRTQPLADFFKQQMETSTIVGDCAVYTDSTTLSVYQITNCAIQSIQPLKINGTDAGFHVALKGYYTINSALWS